MKRREPLSCRAQMSRLIAVGMLGLPVVAAADTRRMAAQVDTQLNARMLDAFAAEDPNNAGRFVAAISIGGHILAISAVHPAPAFVRREITAGNFRRAYSVLITSAKREGRLFVLDLGTPGLTPSLDTSGSFDITRRNSARETMFDGDWGAQKLSEAEYHRRFAIDEGEYLEVLRLLSTALNGPAKSARVGLRE